MNNKKIKKKENELNIYICIHNDIYNLKIVIIIISYL